MNGYTRWTRNPVGEPSGTLRADILGASIAVQAEPTSGVVGVRAGAAQPWVELSPDEARLIGVRLIEAAVHADGDKVIREVAR